MKNILFVFILTLCFYGMFITNSFSQTTSNEVKRNGGLYLTQGLRSYNFSSLNNSLESSGFSAAKQLIPFSGAGGYGWIGRFKVGGEGGYFVSKNKQNKATTELQGFGGHFFTSYLLNPNSVLHFSPLLAVGGESINLFTSKTNSSTDFTQALEQPSTVRLQTGNFYLKTALQLEYKVSRSIFVLQVGYQYVPSQDWQNFDNSLFNAPTSRFSAFFLQFTLGLE